MNIRHAVIMSCLGPMAHAQLYVSPSIVTIPPTGPGFIAVGDFGRGAVKFKFSGVTPEFSSPNFVVVVPSTGITPGGVRVGANPGVAAYMKPGARYSLVVGFTTVDQAPASSVGAIVQFTVPEEPAPSIRSVVNAASLQPFISPGALVTVFGSHLTGPTTMTDYDSTGMYPTSIANTMVTFNGIAAPLRYVSPGQINLIVPFGVAGASSVDVVVERFGQASSEFTMPLLDTSPGIFTAAQNGTGQGAILQLGVDGLFTYNSADNPAAPGAKLQVFATGAGVWTPAPDADIHLTGGAFTTRPVSVTIGGRDAKVTFVGTPDLQGSWSVLRVNVVVPDGIGPGVQEVVLKIGDQDNSEQKVSIAVK